MLFVSFDFLLFFVPVLACYWALARRPLARLALLLGASYFFYVASPRGVGGALPTPWYYVSLLGVSTLVDYVAALRIDAAPVKSLRARLWMLASLSANLGLLGYFKYTGFFLTASQDLADWLGMQVSLPVWQTVLPIGISFYTFQSLSYTIDVWRGRLTPERSFLRFAVYVAFFPQLVAGPIVRASEFLPQFRLRLCLGIEDVNFAVWRVTKGLFKKIVFADFVATNFTDLVFASPEQYSSLENLFALYAFTLQIYADFSGYSDIAIGVARLLGFRLPENFDRPYQSQSVGEFWRRWHITLSTWLRDYLFFPLGGSLVSPARAYFNLWLTMFLVGMWHGASWNFVVYGNLQALAMMYSRYLRQRSKSGRRFGGAELVVVAAVLGALAWLLGVGPLRLDPRLASGLGGAVFAFALLNALMPAPGGSLGWGAAHVALTFHFTTLSRVFFRAEDLQRAREMVGKLLAWDFRGVREGLFRRESLVEWGAEVGGVWGEILTTVGDKLVFIVLVVGIGYHFTPRRELDQIGQRLFAKLPAPMLAVVVAFVAWLGVQLLTGPRANIYFQF